MNSCPYQSSLHCGAEYPSPNLEMCTRTTLHAQLLHQNETHLLSIESIAFLSPVTHLAYGNMGEA